MQFFFEGGGGGRGLRCFFVCLCVCFFCKCLGLGFRWFVGFRVRLFGGLWVCICVKGVVKGLVFLWFRVYLFSVVRLVGSGFRVQACEFVRS